MRLLFIIIVASTLLFSACASGPVTQWDGPPASEAEADYREALERFEKGQYIEATKRFNRLRLEHPFSSRWTTLAELRLADTYLEQGRYAVAAVAYQEFIKSHPTHEDAPFAMLQIGRCHYEEMPSDFFIMPDPWQRELHTARQADAALSRFLKRYPEHEKTEEAQEMLAEVRDRLARHELYVAEFNFERESWIGAANRLQTLLKSYPDSPVAPQGTFLLAHVYLKQDDGAAAAGTLVWLVERYPESDYAEDARGWLQTFDLDDIEPLPVQ